MQDRLFELDLFESENRNFIKTTCHKIIVIIQQFDQTCHNVW